MPDTNSIPGLFMVDDNMLAAQAMERYLTVSGRFRWLGWSPEPAAGIAQVAKLGPDVVLLDVEIPGSDCFATLRALVDASPSSRVVMFSGHAQASLIDHALQDGAAGYIVKDDPTPLIVDLLADAAKGRCVLSPTASSVYMRPSTGRT
jgi:two-component system, NarL family, nitrate/nitrite response regulator NarL